MKTFSLSFNWKFTDLNDSLELADDTRTGIVYKSVKRPLRPGGLLETDTYHVIIFVGLYKAT